MLSELYEEIIFKLKFSSKDKYEAITNLHQL